MKRFAKSILGVTLLEIMLVLAIAAMIIVMSVRYYQSANAGQQANVTVSMISNIVAAADSLAQATGTYTSVTSGQISSIMGTNGLNTPWGAGAVTISSFSQNTFNIVVPTAPAAVCNLVAAKLMSNNHYTTPTCGTTAADFTVTYTSIK